MKRWKLRALGCVKDGVTSWVTGLVCCALAGLAGGCRRDVIEHDSGDSGNEAPFSPTATTGVGDSGGFDGNYPEPVLTRCGPLDNPTTEMPQLQSAWGIVALADSHDPSGAPIAAGSLQVRVAEDFAFDCQDLFTECSFAGTGSGTTDGNGTSGTSGGDAPSRGDDCAWALSFTLSPEELHEGQLVLENLAHGNFEVSSGLWVGPAAPTGVLEIDRLTPDCLVGDITFDVAEDPGLGERVSGDFAIEFCQRTCFPTMQQGCPG